MKSLDLDIFGMLYEDPKSDGNDLVKFVRDSLELGHVSFIVLRHPGSIIFKNNYGFSTYPSEWMDYYIRNQYWTVDPAVILGLRRGAAFDWSECEESRELTRFWEKAQSFGIQSQGFTIPLHGPNREASIFSVSVAEVVEQSHWWNAMRMKFIRELLPVAHFLQQRAFQDLELNDYSSPFMFLTGPKREILYWAAKGKTAAETALILDVTERAIREHREGILRSLDCVSMTQAVAKAMQSGLVDDELPSSNAETN